MGSLQIGPALKIAFLRVSFYLQTILNFSSVLNDPKTISMSVSENFIKRSEKAYQWKVLFNPGTSKASSIKCRPEVFYKKGVLRNFAKFTAKHLCQSRWHRCFPVNFAKFLRTPFITENLWWLFLSFVKKCY